VKKIKQIYSCAACNKGYKTETGLKKHKCDVKARLKAVEETGVGRLAFIYYKQWHKKKGYKTPTVDNFIKSTQFKGFIRFGSFVRNNNIPSAEHFIDFALDSGFNPSLWTNDKVYKGYLDYVSRLPIGELAKIHIRQLNVLSGKFKCSNEVMARLFTVSDYLSLIQSRAFTPFVLLRSKVFLKKLYHASDEELSTFKRLIDIQAWEKVIENHPEEISVIDRMINLLNI
jgi:hypothetical protein